jgi:predicted Fe-S protein YdhL (DUF1289 family)
MTPRPTTRATGAAAAGVPSPCISICRIHAASGHCEGCWRTIDEIAAWSLLDDHEKLVVWQALEARRAGAAASRTDPGDATRSA